MSKFSLILALFLTSAFVAAAPFRHTVPGNELAEGLPRLYVARNETEEEPDHDDRIDAMWLRVDLPDAE
ncbi:hypothetical protein CC1G_14960 [Coprinopsis cinerea okayama7|uniref:Uncharacterized protein n=1 Tax=Coprinopsis cinerea (strain Okayama-7 / 130 / ATCC MYA-4618 / FGSC 9003) TaxID=240176 RepID=D6RP92_COPC7|nr:hypothetical protein CC1G_14960 [Coprinopsis cinerea okayama7\|eukprot:XP_002910629.1 hypothetical protein CC1G_14960 [Coprinopsis cinerea okayama7\